MNSKPPIKLFPNASLTELTLDNCSSTAKSLFTNFVAFSPEKSQGLANEIFYRAISEPKNVGLYAMLCREIVCLEQNMDTAGRLFTSKIKGSAFRKGIIDKCEDYFYETNSGTATTHEEFVGCIDCSFFVVFTGYHRVT